MPRSKRATMLDLPEEETGPKKRCDIHGVGHAFEVEGAIFKCACGKIDDKCWPCGRCGGPVDRQGDRHDLCDY